MHRQSHWETLQFRQFNNGDIASDPDIVVDLQDMLHKLSRPAERVTDAGNGDLKGKRKVRQLAPPVLVMTLTCLFINIYYAIEIGIDASNNREVEQFLEKMKMMETGTNTLMNEMKMRIRHNQNGVCDVSCREAIQEKTTEAVLKALDFNKLEQWKITNVLTSHRHTVFSINGVLGEAQFYYTVMESIKIAVLKQSALLNTLPYWKQMETYEVLFSEELANDMTIFVLSAVCETKSWGETNARQYIEGKHRKNMNFDISFLQNERTERKTSVLFKNFSRILSVQRLLNISQNECYNLVSVLRNKSAQTQTERVTIMNGVRMIQEFELRECIGLLVVILLSCILAGAGGVLFGTMLQEQCKILAEIIKCLTARTNELERQKGCTDTIVDLTCPHSISNKIGNPKNFTDSQAIAISDVTLLTSSIAHFQKISGMFTASQTLQILTLVLELLDERMSQYSVFTVARTRDRQIIISDAWQKTSGDHAISVANMALDIISCCSDLEIGRNSNSRLQLRIGIHTGSCAGLLYRRNGGIRFHLAGSSLVVLSKLHEAAMPNNILITDSTYQILSKTETYRLRPRGLLDVKGLGRHRTYLLAGRRVSVATHKAETPRSRFGSWLELEQKPLYCLNESDGSYVPNEAASRRHSLHMFNSDDTFSWTNTSEEEDV